MKSSSLTASGLKNRLFGSVERTRTSSPAGVNSVAPALAEPCAPSTVPVVTPVKAPVSSTAWAPIHSPPRTMCS